MHEMSEEQKKLTRLKQTAINSSKKYLKSRGIAL
jgi:hypothetical protein